MTGTGGFSSDVERVLDRAGQLDGLAGTAGTIAQELTSALRATERCWGTDEVGTSFAAGHVKAAEDTLAIVRALPGQLAEVGAKLTRTAHIHGGVDQEIATGLPRT
ncbi:hypothetical protein GCM10010174_10860 [Kutzneria viridogrisea]|uniref:WXG100 family type VII secretion target n=2 Tax=Kutzneria TaxID=43356 RepID=W5WKM0_9PSEU|nr:hypothetical protein [Kutzneria albida]AHI01311.1 hypothetical protein KALB_7953 [Kutzneria albida DSM 43870]MBA8926564.1 hypothetical protein [Kutzneria viridogrisea]